MFIWALSSALDNNFVALSYSVSERFDVILELVANKFEFAVGAVGFTTVSMTEKWAGLVKGSSIMVEKQW